MAIVKSEFTFLVTTDNHMGYKHDDHVRRRDSFMAFKEALQIAREKDVDFVLLGGDLFHMNKPNPSIEHKCIKILRQHMNATVQNKKTVSFRRVEGHFSHFEQVKHGNFEDRSLTVPYPIMTIHGNHDDPTGPAGKSVVEKLATCGLLNYFGKVKQIYNEKAMRIEPIIFEKDSIKLALYGIGFIPDRKLRTAWDQGLVTFKEPPKDTFNVLILHQNRRNYDDNKYIPDKYFPKYFHIVIRGHEHDAMAPEIIPESNVNGIVYQPGSTVATSMEIRESCSKQVAIMRVCLNDPRGDRLSRYRLKTEIIDLKCYRKMIFKDIYQKEIFEHIKANDKRRKLSHAEYKSIFRKYVVDCIDRLIEAAENERKAEVPEVTSGEQSGGAGGDSQGVESGKEGSQNSTSQASVYAKLDRFRLPLVRIRCEFKHQVECFDDLEVNALFYPSLVANRDVIKFRKQKILLTPDGTQKNVTFEESNSNSSPNDDDDDNEYEVGQVEAIDLQEERKDTVDTMIMDYFKDKSPSERLKAISLDEYTSAVRSASEDGNIISKELAKKRNAILFSYKSIIKDEHIAGLHFGDEEKVYAWFLSAFKGEKPTLPPGCTEEEMAGAAQAMDTNIGGGGGDEDDDVVVWDDDFTC